MILTKVAFIQRIRIKNEPRNPIRRRENPAITLSDRLDFPASSERPVRCRGLCRKTRRCRSAVLLLPFHYAYNSSVAPCSDKSRNLALLPVTGFRGVSLHFTGKQSDNLHNSTMVKMSDLAQLLISRRFTRCFQRALPDGFHAFSAVRFHTAHLVGPRNQANRTIRGFGSALKAKRGFRL